MRRQCHGKACEISLDAPLTMEAAAMAVTLKYWHVPRRYTTWSASGLSTPATPSRRISCSSQGGSIARARACPRDLQPEPNPKVIVAVGICACTGGIFKECYNIKGGVDTVIPVDIYVPGCAARPQAIIDGVVKAVELLQKKREAFASQRKKSGT